MKDILLDDNFDLAIETGDLKIGDSDYQHVKCILLFNPGELKQFAYMGCSMIRALNGTVSRFMKATIKQNLKLDGFDLRSLNIQNGKIDIDGSY